MDHCALLRLTRNTLVTAPFGPVSPKGHTCLCLSSFSLGLLASGGRRLVRLGGQSPLLIGLGLKLRTAPVHKAKEVRGSEGVSASTAWRMAGEARQGGSQAHGELTSKVDCRPGFDRHPSKLTVPPQTPGVLQPAFSSSPLNISKLQK